MKNSVYKVYSHNNLTWLAMSDNNISKLKADFTKNSNNELRLAKYVSKRNFYLKVVGLTMLLLLAIFLFILMG